MKIMFFPKEIFSRTVPQMTWNAELCPKRLQQKSYDFYAKLEIFP